VPVKTAEHPGSSQRITSGHSEGVTLGVGEDGPKSRSGWLVIGNRGLSELPSRQQFRDALDASTNLVGPPSTDDHSLCESTGL
jgi:hypothetical protein